MASGKGSGLEDRSAVTGSADRVVDGWLAGVRRVLSPNWNERPVGSEISLLVIHNITLPPGEFGGPGIEQFFTNQLDPAAHPFLKEIEALRVSAHLLIRRNGETVQFVRFTDRAWHAGQSRYCDRENCNDFGIGVELEGADDIPYTPAQYFGLAQVATVLMACYPGISPERIVGHSDIAPGRKTDPGLAFDWERFRGLLSDLQGEG